LDGEGIFIGGLMSTLVMKFGGASVATPQHFTQIAKIILDKKKILETVIHKKRKKFINFS